jgi:hypothetical protein
MERFILLVAKTEEAGSAQAVERDVLWRFAVRDLDSAGGKGGHMRGFVRLVMLVSCACGLAASPARSSGIDFRGSLGSHRRYVPPLANPLFNETPYITTEIRPIYLHNELPDGFLTKGGNIDVVAAEIRIALTERLGIIASKDGYADIDFDAALPDADGFANISLGLKYALISVPEEETIVSVGVEYEPPSGDIQSDGVRLQGHGAGFVDVFTTGAQAVGAFGLQCSLGFNLAADQDHDSSMFHYSAHFDYELVRNLFPLIEFNGFTTIDRGNRTDVDFEGIDLVNFGSTDSGTVVTFATGARYRFTEHVQIGAGYELPVTDRQDIMDWRTYVDLVLSY